MDDFFGEHAMDSIEDGVDGNLLQAADDNEENRPKNDEEILQAMGATTKKPRTQRNYLKLNEVTLTNTENGIATLPKLFENFVPSEEQKVDEFILLRKMMTKLEHWSHCLYPSLPFDDVLAKIEHLGSKRAVQTQLSKIRMGMPLTDEDFTPLARNQEDRPFSPDLDRYFPPTSPEAGPSRVSMEENESPNRSFENIGGRIATQNDDEDDEFPDEEEMFQLIAKDKETENTVEAETEKDQDMLN